VGLSSARIGSVKQAMLKVPFVVDYSMVGTCCVCPCIGVTVTRTRLNGPLTNLGFVRYSLKWECSHDSGGFFCQPVFFNQGLTTLTKSMGPELTICETIDILLLGERYL
jgi:hypothetical protein